MAIFINISKWYLSVECLHKGINVFVIIDLVFEIYGHILLSYHFLF